MTTVKSITIEFSRGSFQEWTEAAGDIFPQAFIDEWQINYHQIITERLQEAFPEAKIEVGEGYDQLGNTKIYIDFDSYEGTEWGVEYSIVEADVENLLDIGSDGNALDAVWTIPTIGAISEAIDAATDKRPVIKFNYEGANFVFAKHNGAIWWMDLDIDDPLNPDDEWTTGTLEDAAIAFRDEFDPDFVLITQSEAAEIVGVSVAAINNAIRDGRLQSYRKNDTKAHKPGANLVSRADVLRAWGFDIVNEEGQQILKSLNEINQNLGIE